MVVPTFVRIWFPGVIDIYIFPVILFVSFTASWLGTLLTKPENMEILKKFYIQTRPWGFWKPVISEVLKEAPAFIPNMDFGRDSFNVIIGIIWQMSMVVIPLYLLSGNYRETIIAAVVLLITSFILKKTWYDNLKYIE